jgi:nitrite reductase/ring-hydroxylating ferredoxin subunit
MPQLSALDALENATPLDPVADKISSVVHGVLSPRVKDLLHGVWLGHALHPALVQLPVGAWTSAAVLDAFPAAGRTPDALIALGLAGLPAAVATGWTDWSDLHQQQKRVGLVHAASNVLAGTIYATSLVARRRGHRGRGRLLGWTAFTTAGLGAFLGGHLAYRQSAGTNHAEFVPHLVEPGWHDLGSFDELPEGRPVSRSLGTVELMVVRTGDRTDVLANRCSHLDGPLAEGELQTEAGEQCISCPWHGSTFRLRDGAVVHGPATASQPAFRSQVVDGRLQVMLEGAG